MRSLTIGFLAFVALTFNTSCKKAKEEINKSTVFTMNYTNEASVPASTVGVTAPVEFTTPEFETNANSRFDAEKTTNDLIEDITLSKFVIHNQSGNLDFLKSIKVFIKAPGVNDVEVASKASVPAGITSLTLDVTGLDIKHHIFKDKIQFRVVATINTATGNTEQLLKMEEAVTVRGKRL